MVTVGATQGPAAGGGDLRGAHDLRHTFAIPARVIDELMSHEATGRGAQHLGSAMGAHYRHTTPEMEGRVSRRSRRGWCRDPHHRGDRGKRRNGSILAS